MSIHRPVVPGKMLGGCSAVSAQIFHCGAPSDHDEWGRTGIEGANRWSYQLLRKYFLRFENFTPSAAHPAVDSSMRGSSGPIQSFRILHSIASTFITAYSMAGIPFTDDFNTPHGTLWVGKVLNRPNLCVYTHATATKVAAESTDGAVRARAVEVSPDQGVTHTVIKTRKKVILSAGAVHSPQILILSGLGLAEHLQTQGIPVVVDLAGVGDHLMDHPVADTIFEETSGTSLFYFSAKTSQHRMKFASVVVRYLLTGKGPLSTNWQDAGAFFCSSDPKLFSPADYPKNIENTASGPDAPDLEMTVSAMDADLEEHIPIHLESLYHPTSTARMAPLDAGGVVDAQLRVHGVPDFRVVDASIFPTIPSGHTIDP
ncbi:choline dehydrogenase [Mycena olivaceomarginata]|nr:choline dehydrogenase [Mycena olivaceomarginata]